MQSTPRGGRRLRRDPIRLSGGPRGQGRTSAPTPRNSRFVWYQWKTKMFSVVMWAEHLKVEVDRMQQKLQAAGLHNSLVGILGSWIRDPQSLGRSKKYLLWIVWNFFYADSATALQKQGFTEVIYAADVNILWRLVRFQTTICSKNEIQQPLQAWESGELM